MSRILLFKNQQRVKRLDLPLIKKITLHVLTELLSREEFELGFHFVAAKKMAEVNEEFLQHTGSTDVITFDYNPPAPSDKRPTSLNGEVFICIDDAMAQAREFRTTWQSELIRYIVHAILHLEGFDDLNPMARKKMKREENQLVRVIEKTFAFNKIEKR